MLPLPSLSWEAPDRLADALQLLAQPGAMPIAGGTDLVPSLKHRLFAPEILVSLRRLPLRSNDDRGDGIALGAGLTLRELARDGRIRERWPALADAAATIATPTVQGMGTLGGNVMLDTRCAFYNQPAGWRAALGYCLKREGTVCHVAPKGKGCYAAHSADTIPALWLYDARLVLVSARGEREVPVRDLYTDDGMRWHRVERDELATHVVLPKGSARVVHRKLRTRGAIDYGLLLVAVRRDEAGYTAVVSAVGPRPIEVTGRTPDEVAEAAYEACQPLSTHLANVPWRKKMVRVEVRRAAEALPS
jgi:4-hydroxybenzoyl-CoA reductase subunit beta